MDFTSPDLGSCDPQQLADQLSTALGMPVTCDVDGTRVIVYEDVTGSESQVQAVIDSYVFDPDYGLPDRTWRDRLLTEIIFLSDQLASLTGGLSNAQRDAAIKRLIRNQIRLLKFVRDNTLDSDA